MNETKIMNDYRLYLDFLNDEEFQKFYKVVNSLEFYEYGKYRAMRERYENEED